MTQFKDSFDFSDAQPRSSGITRRSALSLALSGASVALVAACSAPAQQAAPTTAAKPAATPGSSTASPVAGSSPVAAPTTTAQPKAGGKLVNGIVGDILSLDGHSTGPIQVNVVWHHFDKLTEYDDNSVPQPSLAESWELSSDAKQIKLNLRKGVQFHSGRELESEDIRWNLLRLRDPKGSVARTFGAMSAWWTGIETPDKNTIILTSEKPRPGVFDLFQHMCILDKDVTDSVPATKIGGTGPFKFVEWAPGDHFTSVKNPNYWRPNRPYLDEVTTRMFKDAVSMISSLEAGAIDMAYAPNLRDVTRLQNDPKYTLLKTTDLGQWFHVTVNTKQAPLDNKLVRQALNYAVDRKRWTESVLRGLAGGPVSLPYPPKSPAFNAAKNDTYSFDLDKAKGLLAQAGVGPLTMDINYATLGFSSEYADLAQIYQADLAKIGITTNIKPQETANFSAQGLQVNYNGIRLNAGAFANFPEASTTFTFLSNASGWVSQEFNDLVAAASVEPDAAKRKAIYTQLNDIWLEECPFMPISLYPSTALVKSNFHGLKWYFNPVMTYQDAWVS